MPVKRLKSEKVLTHCSCCVSSLLAICEHLSLFHPVPPKQWRYQWALLGSNQ